MLSDGYFNLNIVPNHDPNCRNGLYHFGFRLTIWRKMDKRKNRVVKAAKGSPGESMRKRELQIQDGNYFDLSEHAFLDINPAAEEKD